MRELGWPDALNETDQGVYWPSAACPRKARFNRCGASIPREDKWLVQVVEELQGEANGHCAELKMVSIPEDVSWVIAKANRSEHVVSNIARGSEPMRRVATGTQACGLDEPGA